MERIRARDTAAFEAIYDQYHRLVYGLALRVLSDRGAAEDVTQAVFLTLWDSPALFRGGNFACLDRSRRAQPRTRRPAEPRTARGKRGSRGDAGRRYDRGHRDRQRQRRARPRRARASPPEQREPIELGFFGGVTHEEIARRAGVPLGTVKTRIRTGLRRLRSALEGAVTV